MDVSIEQVIPGIITLQISLACPLLRWSCPAFVNSSCLRMITTAEPTNLSNTTPHKFSSSSRINFLPDLVSARIFESKGDTTELLKHVLPFNISWTLFIRLMVHTYVKPGGTVTFTGSPTNRGKHRTISNPLFWNRILFSWEFASVSLSKTSKKLPAPTYIMSLFHQIPW